MWREAQDIRFEFRETITLSLDSNLSQTKVASRSAMFRFAFESSRDLIVVIELTLLLQCNENK